MKRFTKHKDAKDLSEQGRIILAHGEVTGHCHEVIGVDTAADLAIPLMDYFEEPDGRQILLVTGKCELLHEEHSTETRTFLDRDGTVIARDVKTGAETMRVYPAQVRQGDVFLQPIAPGAWERLPQSEYTPEAIRNVAD